jgi:NADPH:quinone reductase-like Zn-dependent oxidoreductase
MKAYFLKKYGSADKAFELREMAIPEPTENQIQIKTDAFGLNFADVMARQGLYQDAPPLPAVLGYEVVGRVSKVGSKVKNFQIGQRVVALTRFGGYAEYAITDERAAVSVPEEMDMGVAAAIATQYCTAYYCAYEMAPLFEGQHVLVQAAAGGVGIALVQMAKNKGCVVYGTAGSEDKVRFLRELGVDHPINYKNTDFETYVKKLRGKEGLDVIFDSLGGKAVKKGFNLLGSGGRIVCLGVGSRANKAKGIINDLSLALGFGIYSPIQYLLNSKGMIGVNMLRLADNKPDTLQRCMKNVSNLIINKELNPHVGGKFSHTELAKAHDFLGGRGSIGKIIVHW